jgi:hypothetical protein
MATQAKLQMSFGNGTFFQKRKELPASKSLFAACQFGAL